MAAVNARFLAERFADRATRQIGCRWGESFPFYYVTEYPRSGGTWLARMISDYLQIPFPSHYRLPLAFRCVLHNHWRYDPRLRRVFYLHRDGRDVMVSLYFHRLRVSRFIDRPGKTYVRNTYEKLFGENYDPRDVVRHLPRFIEFEFGRPGRGTPLNWRDHILDWHCSEHDETIAHLSYEELRRDCAATLARAIETVTGDAVEPLRLAASVEKMSMLRQTGRRHGESDLRHHNRKGIVGDWLNHFSREAAELFDHLAGDMLVQLAYERDRRWIDRYQYQTA